MGRLARWFGASDAFDPDEVVEFAYVPIHESQLMLRALSERGIEAFGVDEVRSAGMGGIPLVPSCRLFARRRDVVEAAAIVDAWNDPGE